MKYQALGLATLVLAMAIVISVILLFLGMGILVLIHVCVVGRALTWGFGHNDNNNRLVAAARGSIGSGGMSRDDLEKLPCFEFNAKEMKASTTASPVDCAVCLENFKAGEKCRLLPSCLHSFHAECVDMWLLRTPICPVCRATADLLVAGGVGESRRLGDITTGGTGDQLRNYVHMITENGRLSMPFVESPAGQSAENGSLTESSDEPGNGRAPTLSTEPASATGESPTPANSGN